MAVIDDKSKAILSGVVHMRHIAWFVLFEGSFKIAPPDHKGGFIQWLEDEIDYYGDRSKLVKGRISVANYGNVRDVFVQIWEGGVNQDERYPIPKDDYMVDYKSVVSEMLKYIFYSKEVYDPLVRYGVTKTEDYISLSKIPTVGVINGSHSKEINGEKKYFFGDVIDSYKLSEILNFELQK